MGGPYGYVWPFHDRSTELKYYPAFHYLSNLVGRKLNLGEWPIAMRSDVSESTMPFEEEGSLSVCGVLHVVLLHSSCVRAPLWLTLKAFAGKICRYLPQMRWLCISHRAWSAMFTKRLNWMTPKKQKSPFTCMGV